MIKNIIYYLYNMNTLIFPCYKDLYKLNYLKNIIPNNCNLIIYEKKDEISKNEFIIDDIKCQDNNHYLIPLLGEQHFALIIHIIKNYDILQNTIHFSKTHWIPVFSSLDIFKNELLLSSNIMYKQHNCLIRKFVCIFLDLQTMGHKEAIIYLLQENNKYRNQKIISYNNNCNECNNNLKCFNCGMFRIKEDPEFNNILFTTSYLQPNSSNIIKLKQIFPDYNPITELIPCSIDGSYIINSKIILYHNIDIYKDIYNTLIYDCHDSLTMFFHIFFLETLKRYKSSIL